MIEYNAKIETFDKKDGLTPLIATMIEGHLDASKLLVEKGADLMGRRGGVGMTPLMNAIGLQREAIRDFISEYCWPIFILFLFLNSFSYLSFFCLILAKENGKKGEMRKQGGGHRSKGWKKRFFVLYGTYFFYYKSDKVGWFVS